ncbi:MAG TPA: BREX-3 system phosphatase PglZ [Anaerolineae bacterium]|nr:BREX-3 system phosphatase PglZ [Anaerolineae bacterium]
MSQSWRDAILAEFIPQLAPLTLVADPDSLLADERIQEALQGMGFEVVEYQDPIAFRYLFETTYRPRWEAGTQIELVVALRFGEGDLNQLPYDLLQNGRRLAFSLSTIFPQLTYNEVAALDRLELDALYAAIVTFHPTHLGENGTCDFILRHVFGIDAHLVKDEADLLMLLLRLHMGKRPLPAPFADRLLKQLQQNGRFADWPLDSLLADPSALYAFLQERWPIYLDKQVVEKVSIREASMQLAYDLEWNGPLLLPFGKADIRAFIDTLFLEGKLHPIAHQFSDKLNQLWVSIGIQQDPELDRGRRLTRLLTELESRLPTSESGHQDWLNFASAWAESVALCNMPAARVSQKISQQFNELQTKLDATFGQWLANRYNYLSTFPPHPPVMVHHIPRSLARQIKPQSPEKVALIVMDGLAFDQWLIVRESLLERLANVRFQEEAVFAWIPTITSVSRQAIFAGKSPYYFPDSISTTAKEAKLWSLFWEDRGLLPTEIGFEKKLRSFADFDRVEQLIARPKIRVVGLVVDQVDHMMHGMTLGLSGLHQQLRLWLKAGFLAELIKRLTQAEYEVYLTSDHGNVAAKGIGRPREGALADLRGERVRIYPNDTLRQHVQQDYETAVAWSTAGLPTNFYPLLAPNRHAFTTKGETTVTHGGNLLEEVIVPYVKVTWSEE